MTLSFNLKRGVLRTGILGLASVGYLTFIAFALTRFAHGVAADTRMEIGEEIIEQAAAYFPNSARLQARLAARLIEMGAAQADTHEELADRAVKAAERAVRLGPWQYENWVLLSAARELKGDLSGAETALDESLKRAPNNINVHWRLANLLLREDKLERALSEFSTTLSVDSSRLPASLEIVWMASGGRPDALLSILGDRPQDQLALARFLVRQGEINAAIAALKKVDSTRIGETPEECGRLIEELLAAHQVEAAAALWREAVGAEGDDASEAFENGGFETPIHPNLRQFDWRLEESEYARIGVGSPARAGERGLKIVYLERETTKLVEEIQKLVVVSPGARYRLECYAKAENLMTPGGPQVVVLNPETKTPLASTAAVAADRDDWQELSVEFNAPPDARSLIVSVRQTPQFSYVEPTRGTVLFDDFSLRRRQ
jgi:tetratricopeptide (TPR) repeat protein